MSMVASFLWDTCKAKGVWLE